MVRVRFGQARFVALSIVLGLACCSVAVALDRTWIGGNVDWVDAGATANWTPADEPDSDDRAIFNTANTVNFGSNNSVNGLALSGGIDLFTNDFDLSVDGLVEASGAGTNLFIEGAASTLTANNITINSSADIEMNGGVLSVHDFTLAIGLLDINVGGELLGNGTVNLSEPPAVPTTLLVNDGAITASSTPLIIFGEPPIGTLSINAPNASGNGRVDLDGAAEAGVVNVNRNQTLDLNVAFADSFNGTINLAHNSTFDSLNAWTLAGGSIVVNNGFVAGGIGVPDVPADTSFIDGGLLTQTGGTINVADTDGTLQMDSAFTMSGGTFANSGTVIFNGATSITTAAGYNPSSLNAQTIINANVTINDGATNFNWDGNGAADTTVNNGVLLSITAAQVDTTDNIFGGDIILNDASDLSVNVTATSWTLGGALTKNDAGTSTVSGDRIIITGTVNANDGTLDLPAVTTSATANISTAGNLFFGGASEFAGGTIGGTGTLLMETTSTVTANTTVSVANFHWDGLGSGNSHTINSGVTFTINSPVFDGDGNMDDSIILAGSGSVLNVNGPTEWTMIAAINANNAGVGTATIGGTSRLILSGANADLNVNGNTNINAPLTLGSGSLVVIDAGFSLDANGATTYSGGVIDGAGTYVPAATNTVTAFSQIAPDIFHFDAGNWVVEHGATLVVNTTDYDSAATNSFDGTVTINEGEVEFTSSDAFFVMDGTLNMQAGQSKSALWSGEPIHIGNDAGSLDADINASGSGSAIFDTIVNFNSDADVDVSSILQFQSAATVNFNTVNGVNNAQFTGSGTITFSGLVNVNEAVTFNMAGGSIDLDGVDNAGNFINIDAPMNINVEEFSNFGRVNGGGGVNTLDINNSVGTGVLTVNLDDPNAEWTLNGPGVMNLVNDNTEATLLAGSDVNINGTLNVTGDVRSTARLDIAGVVNLNTAGQPLRLAGGNTGDPNMLLGGTISGAGVLGADTGIALHGFGTINTGIDFDGASNLFADNGTLTINGSILDVNRIGTDDADGVLNVVNPWNTSVASFVTLNGGTIQGGTMTIDNVNAVSGFGTIASRVINNTGIRASSGTLIVETAGNDNDWDGAANSASLHAQSDSTLELRDNLTFGFTGAVSMFPGGKVFANGFALDFNPGSSLFLNSDATYESNRSTDLGGVVTTSAGPASTIKIQNNFFLTFESTSTTTLVADLRLENNNINIEAGATFSGSGALVIPDGSHVVADNLANIGVLMEMNGAYRPGNFEGIGRVDMFDYQQGETGELYVELRGSALNAFDRLVLSGDAVVDGYLNIDIDEISPGVPFVPSLGQTYNIITGNTVTGQFDYYDVSGMPAGLAFSINYLANAVQLEVVEKEIFAADFDEDGDVDQTDYAIWVGAFNLNQLGDATGDNISNAADYTVWRDQLGSVSDGIPGSGGFGLAAVPEPGTAVLGLLGHAAICGFRRRIAR